MLKKVQLSLSLETWVDCLFSSEHIFHGRHSFVFNSTYEPAVLEGSAVDLYFRAQHLCDGKVKEKKKI